MIRWIPATNGFWDARKYGEVNIYGAEAYISGKNWRNQQLLLEC